MTLDKRPYFKIPEGGLRSWLHVSFAGATITSWWAARPHSRFFCPPVVIRRLPVPSVQRALRTQRLPRLPRQLRPPHQLRPPAAAVANAAAGGAADPTSTPNPLPSIPINAGHGDRMMVRLGQHDRSEHPGSHRQGLQHQERPVPGQTASGVRHYPVTAGAYYFGSHGNWDLNLGQQQLRQWGFP